MKVAFFIGSLNRGGTETLTLDICREGSSTLFDIVLIYRNEGELSDSFRETGVKMVRIKPGRMKIGYFADIRKVLKKEEIEIVHCQTLTNAVIAVVSTLFTHVKVVASFHGFYRSFKERIRRHFVMWSADALIFVSKYEYAWYLKTSLLCPRTRCHVVYNGLSFDKFDRIYPTPDFLVEESGSQHGIVRMAMVGNFVSGRSQLFVCKCLKALMEKHCRAFTFYFIGKRVDSSAGRFDDCIRFCEDNQLNDYVRFLGGRGDVPAILQHIDAFVYASEHDSFGIAVVEAVAAGLPTLVNDWMVMQEIVGERGWAEMYRTNDVEECASKMKVMMDKIELRKRIAQKAKIEVRNVFSIKTHINRLFEIYTSLVQ